MILTNYAAELRDSVHITNDLQIISIAVNLSQLLCYTIFTLLHHAMYKLLSSALYVNRNTFTLYNCQR